MAESITRDELRSIIATAAKDITPSTREKLLAVADRTDAVAVGWFHCDGVRCPARQAGRHNQAFQGAFDAAMASRFGRSFYQDEEMPVHPFVVNVSDAPREEQRG